MQDRYVYTEAVPDDIMMPTLLQNWWKCWFSDVLCSRHQLWVIKLFITITQAYCTNYTSPHLLINK